MFEYITVKEASEKWGISERRIQKLCEEKRIEGVVRFSHAWAIPANAIKPVDGRRKENKDNYHNQKQLGGDSNFSLS